MFRTPFKLALLNWKARLNIEFKKDNKKVTGAKESCVELVWFSALLTHVTCGFELVNSRTVE